MTSQDPNATATPTTDPWDISGPGPDTGANDPTRWRNSAHVGHTVVFIHHEAEEKTSRQPGGEKYMAANVSVVVCLDCNRCWTDVAVTGKALVPRLISAQSEIVVGALVEGEKTPGFDNAPILLEDASPGTEDLVRTMLATYGHRMPSGLIIFDHAAFNGPKPF